MGKRRTLLLCAKLATVAIVAAAAVLPMRAANAADALSASEQRGLALLRANCSRCHAIGRTGNSPFEPAPPFRTLHRRYPVESLEEPLAEGIVTGHPEMPEFSFEPEQIGDVIAYLKSLER